MVEQEHKDHKAVEIVRPELAERGLSDPLEFLYQHMPEFSDSERISLLVYSLEAEEQAFEVQCCVCAAYADGRRLREFIERYNKEATAMGGKTISYQYSRQMSQIGQRLVQAEKRMTADYPALSPSYFVTALKAPEFTAALDQAQERVVAYQEAPAEEPKYTIRQFKADLNPKDPPDFLALQAEEEGPFPSVRSCYDCEYCWQPNDHQVLAIVNTVGTMAIDMVLEQCASWVCRKYRRVISVRTQTATRAEAMAKSCSSFSLRSAPAPRESEAVPGDESNASTSGTDGTEQAIEASLHDEQPDSVGPAMDPEQLEKYLEEVPQ